MQNYIEQHKQRKERVLEFLNQSIQCMQNMNNTEKEINNLEEFKQIVENDLFSIVVVGEFSSGKSTFLNALMHKKILPSFTKETTATVNFLRHTEMAENGEKGKVYYNNGEIKILQNLNEEEIKRFVSTESNECVAKEIKKVDFYLDSEFLQNGVMLVDSPGLNGIEEGHKEITEKQIKESHAVIFVFNAQQPGSNTNFESLSDIKQYSKNIFFLLNKIDCIKESEGETPETVIATLKNNYKKRFPDDMVPEIWPVSAELALEARDMEWYEKSNNTLNAPEDCLKFSLIEKFENRLWKYLTCGEKSREQLKRPIEVSIKLLEEKQKSLEHENNMLKDDDGECKANEKKDFLEKEIKELNDKKNQTVLDVDIANKIIELKERVGADCQKAQERINTKIKNFDDREELIEFCLVLDKEVRKQAKKIVQTTNETVKKEINKLIQQNIKEYYNSLERKIRLTAVNLDESSFIGVFEVPNSINTKNIDEAKKKIEEIDKIISSLRKEKDKYKEEMYESKKYESELKKLENRLSDLEKEKKELRLLEMDLPNVRTHVIEVEDSRDREGWIGKFVQKLIGKKHIKVQSTAYDEEDRQFRKEQKNEISKAKQKVDCASEKLQDLIDKYQTMGRISSSSWEGKVDSKNEEIQEYKREKQKIEKEIIDLIKNTDEKIKKKVSSQAKDYLEDNFYTICNNIKNSLDENCEKYIGYVREVVNHNIIKDLEIKEKNLAELVAHMQLQGDERKQKMQELAEQLNMVKSVIAEGMVLQELLANELDDRIGNEEFIND